MTEPSKNALTVDVEDYFHVSAFTDKYPLERWPEIEARVEKNSYRLLTLFNRFDKKATFFMLGWVAERCPELVRDIVDQGHELASHGYWHQRANHQSREEFREDICRAKALLEDISGQRILGYRAPSFSIGKQNSWAFDELAGAGYVYSSSTYPIEHDHYGTPDWPRFAYRCRDNLLEIPVTTLQLGQRHIPIGGGGYFRLYPYWLSRWALNKFRASEQSPGVFYFHPWEIDPQQPRPDNIDLKTRLRHYLNLQRMEGRLERLLSDFEWGPMAEVFSSSIAATSSARATPSTAATSSATAATTSKEC